MKIVSCWYCTTTIADHRPRTMFGVYACPTCIIRVREGVKERILEEIKYEKSENKQGK